MNPLKVAHINKKDIERAKAVTELSKILIAKWNGRYQQKYDKPLPEKTASKSES